MKILMIEDDQKIIENVDLILKIAWPDICFLASKRADGGIKLFNKEKPDLVIVDICLPDTSGFEVIKQIRSMSSVPVLILSALAEERDVVRGLELGANDYISKPFRQMELIARIRNLTRKSVFPDEDLSIKSQNIRFGLSIRQIYYNESEIQLTRTEGRILHKLLQKKNKVVTYQELSNELWGDALQTAIPSIKVYIKHLREKLGDDSLSYKIIQNIPQVGYMLVDQADR
ncbi:DNA-binding response regulator [Dehalococcoides mccartyi]|uniref:DNA-binding response regulator n=1 Tax=Dehalococcoides mccartyi TaxID=61435 RepID=A0A2J1E041_9CHLR|nr:DNA-binding response regulator [Dehalococcoides mccartyi]